jgi:hypothetical protein
MELVIARKAKQSRVQAPNSPMDRHGSLGRLAMTWRATHRHKRQFETSLAEASSFHGTGCTREPGVNFWNPSTTTR